jgi:type I restriction enzyme S subunit
MSNDWFFEKFALIADAPGAVEKMRGLVLDWALFGQFSQKSNVPVKYVRLDSVADIRMGNSPPGHSYNETGLGVPLINGPVEFSSGPLGLTVRTKFTTSPTKLCKRGDLLICVRGSTTGRTNIAAFDACIGRGVAAITAHDNQFYINLFVWSQRAKIFALGTGSTFPSISYDDLASLKLTLPPLAEQKRIVAKVDELMGLCDALESQQQERELRKSVLVRSSLSRFAEAPTPENLGYLFHKSYDIPPSELRKSILTLAVQGKLVEQDINDESVKDLLLRNDARRREIARNDHRANEDNQLLLSADDRWEVTDTWSWQGLADLVLFVDYRGKTPVKMSDGIRLLTAKNVRKGHINLSPEEFLSESEYRDWMTRGFPKVGDVLFTTEAPMGNAAVVKLSERFALAQRIICFQSYGAIDPAFLVLQINSDQFQSILNTNGTGVTAKGIKASKLKQLPIAVPPLAEQRRIVAKVDKLMALVDELERQQDESREKATKLLDAIVQEMTSGERGIAATLES